MSLCTVSHEPSCTEDVDLGELGESRPSVNFAPNYYSGIENSGRIPGTPRESRCRTLVKVPRGQMEEIFRVRITTVVRKEHRDKVSSTGRFSLSPKVLV